METFLTILAGILVLAIVLKLVKIVFWMIFKTMVGSAIALAGLLTGIFFLVR